jgi:hypothetical protein
VTARRLDLAVIVLAALARAGELQRERPSSAPDPGEQLAICAGLGVGDATSCVRGTKVQNLIGYLDERFFELVARCEIFPAPAKPECYRWLAKTISVVTDGEFARTGCPSSRGPRRSAPAERGRGAATTRS